MLNVETPLAMDMSVQSHPLCLSTKIKNYGEDVTALRDKNKELNGESQLAFLSNHMKTKNDFQFSKNLKRKNCEIAEKHSKARSNESSTLSNVTPSTIGVANKMSPSIKCASPAITQNVSAVGLTENSDSGKNEL